MARYRKGGLIGKTIRIFEAIGDLKISLHAANAGYFIILSVFPAMVLLLGLLRYTDLDPYDLLAMLEGVLPDALLPHAERFIINTYDGASGTVIGVSAVTALWSASRGIYGLLTGLNAIYRVGEDRGFFFTRFISVVYTFLFLLVLILTLVLHVFGTTIIDMLPPDALWGLLDGIVDLRFFLLLFLQTALFTAMFMVFPNRRNRFADSLPGALLASIGWLVFSDAFSIYVTHFSNYANLYGSVYAVALSMLWLYFCLSIVFYGGALNHYLMEREKKNG